MYYDRHSDQWSDYACYKAGNKDRCVKMDCHLSDTHFSLLGFFKEPNYGEWMEQLFKHEGDCVWTDDEYQFMQNDRETWPEDCTATDFVTSQNEVIYYDLQPAAYGSYGIGLYTDAACTVYYTEGQYTTEYVLEQGAADQDDDQQNSGSIYQLEKQLATWNSAFDVFKQCQPCKAYALTDIVAGMGYQANADGTRYGEDDDGEGGGRRHRRKLEDDEDEDEEFQCHDDAGYDSVNQVCSYNRESYCICFAASRVA
jgi:hypothetical protein